MDTFGDRVRSERLARGLSTQAVAETLGVDEEVLRALERNDFGALPDEAVMKDCLHGYAECLDVDADLMIEDYVQERDRALLELEEVEPEPVAEPERRPWVAAWPVALVVVAIAILTGWWMLSGDGVPLPPEAPPETSAATPIEPQPPSTPPPAEVAPLPVERPATRSVPEPPAEPPAARTAPEPPAEPRTTRSAPEPPAEPPAARTAPAAPKEPSSLNVRRYGVGTAVENRRLVGEGDRFSEGTRAFFWTSVEGGAPGDTIDHVWLREGAEVARVSLDIGASSWNTHSFKTLQAGVAGDWAVEARDAAGRVLARSEFVCVP